MLPLRRGKRKHLLGDRLQELDALLVGFDVKVVVVSLLFDAMESLFVTVLAMRNEARIFRSPRRV